VSVAEIHSTAIVAEGARIGKDARVGAFSIIGPDVELEEGVDVREHVVIEGRSRIGAGTEIHPFALIGGAPQDLSYRGEATSVEIGPNCRIREHATVHRGTARGRGVTRVGANCFLMIGSHVAHDCVVGDNVILVNNVSIAGHVEIGDYTIISGNSGVQQHGRIGAHAFVGAFTGVATDVIPFASAIGYRAELAGLNIVGLKRRGFDRPTIHALRAAYQAIFNGTGTLAERVDTVAADFKDVPAVMMIVDFIRSGEDRPLCTPRD
jgi:UDP-N-acetylglucosamine acyltransferase